MLESVKSYYTNMYKEENRHNDPFGLIQELRTKEIIMGKLEEGMSVLDIGGANGVYSFYLADQGFQTSILDITPRHIDLVIERNKHVKNKLEGIYLGDAVNFSIDKKFDLIILHGPLYHITNRTTRTTMINNVKKLLNPGGKILGFAINRYAGYFYGVRSGMIMDSKYKTMVLEEVRTGYREKGTGWHFHKPDELLEEFKECGLDIIDIKNVSGQLWMLPNIDDLIKNEENLSEILCITRELENELNIGQDLVCIASV